MTRSEKGREIIARIPRAQTLSETDGPFVQVRGAPAKPWDTALVEHYLATLWKMSAEQARAQLCLNFVGIVGRLKATAQDLPR